MSIPSHRWLKKACLGGIFYAKVTLIGLLVASPVYADKASDKAWDAKMAEIAARHNPDVSSLSYDVGKTLDDARWASRYGDDCNMEHLGARERLLTASHMNLMAMRASTFGTMMELAANLREIFKGMEKMFPGGPTAYDALMKPTQAALGNLGPYGKIAKSVTEVADNYKDWHNSEVAKDLSANVKRQAKTQMEALKAMTDRLKEIETAMDEVERLTDTVISLMQSYPQRCLKGRPITPPFLRMGETNSVLDIEGDVFTEMQKPINDCDLAALIKRIAYLDHTRGLLEDQQEALGVKIVAAINDLHTSLGKFEGQLPKYEAKDFMKLLKSGEGLVTGVAGLDKATAATTDAVTGETKQFTGGSDFKSAKPSDYLPLEEVKAAMDKSKAADAVKKEANKKLQVVKDLLKERDRINDLLTLLRKDQAKIQKLIETWEERCLMKDDPALGLLGIPERPTTGTSMGDTTGTTTGTGGITLAGDSPKWCTYGEGTPTTYVPGGGTTTGTPTSSGGTPTSSGGSPTSSGGSPTSSGGSPIGGVPTDLTPEQESCWDELKLINTFMDKHGDALKAKAKTNARAATDLANIEARKKELEEECPGSDPRDAGDPGGGTTTGTPTGTPTATSVPRKPGGDDPRDAGEPTIVIYVKAKSVASTTAVSTGGAQIKLLVQATTNVALPGDGVAKPQTDHNQNPVQGVTDGNGNLTLVASGTAIGLTSTPTATGTAFEIAVDTTAQASVNVRTAGNPQSTANSMPSGVLVYMTDSNTIGGKGFLTFTFPNAMLGTMQRILINIPGVVSIQINYCRDKAARPEDPLFKGNKAWGQQYDNQWAIKRVGIDGSSKGAQNLLGRKPSAVTVAVIDTGLDWNHLDFNWDNLWQNPGEIRDNGIDDDGNGYVDDLIGWDFFGRHNNPWDHDGHGTFVSGIIAADTDNGIGIAGINPHAKIMVLKALNSFGHTRASYLAKAIVYAVDNGAQIINMSVGGKEMTEIEQAAIEYANSEDVLVVIAAGNEGLDVSNYGIAGLSGVITVASTDLDDKRVEWSNWGAEVDISAPGMEVLSLRARRTDTMRDIPDVEYENGANYVGEDLRYYRASGTSFSAPIVSGIASMLLSRDPSLTAAQVKQVLQQSAEDLEVPGVDQFTGYGMVNAVAALKADADYFVDSAISGVEVVQEGGVTLVRVRGTANANKFGEAHLELGEGETPSSWEKVGSPIKGPIKQGVLGDIDAGKLAGSTTWRVRVITTHKNGSTREAWFLLSLG